MTTKNSKDLNLKKSIKEALKKPPSKFDIYAHSEEGQDDLNSIINSLQKIFKEKNKEELIEIFAFERLELYFKKNVTSLGAKAKNEPYKKYYQMVSDVYTELLFKNETLDEIISIKNLNKALDIKYPNIHWHNNRISSNKDKVFGEKPVINIAQMHRVLAHEHKLFLMRESASIDT